MHVDQRLERTQHPTGEIRDPRQEHSIEQYPEAEDRQTPPAPVAADHLGGDLEARIDRAGRHQPGFDPARLHDAHDRCACREGETQDEEGPHAGAERDEIARHRSRPGRHITHRSGEGQMVGAHGSERQLGILPVDRVLHEDEADHQEDQQDRERERSGERGPDEP